MKVLLFIYIKYIICFICNSRQFLPTPWGPGNPKGWTPILDVAHDRKHSKQIHSGPLSPGPCSLPILLEKHHLLLAQASLHLPSPLQPSRAASEARSRHSGAQRCPDLLILVPHIHNVLLKAMSRSITWHICNRALTDGAQPCRTQLGLASNKNVQVLFPGFVLSLNART